MKKKGYLIAYFGPDGSGKSTTVKELRKLLKNEKILNLSYHWRPRILPSLKKNMNEIYLNIKPNLNKTRPSIISFILYFYFFLDFLIAYHIKFKKQLNNGVWINYERYFYDLLIHPQRYKLKHFYFLGKFLSKIVPKPCLIVILKGKASIIYSRKTELPIEEITRQQEIAERIFSKSKNKIEIDVTKFKPNDIAKNIFEHIHLKDIHSLIL